MKCTHFKRPLLGMVILWFLSYITLVCGILLEGNILITHDRMVEITEPVLIVISGFGFSLHKA